MSNRPRATRHGEISFSFVAGPSVVWINRPVTRQCPGKSVNKLPHYIHFTHLYWICEFVPVEVFRFPAPLAPLVARSVPLTNPQIGPPSRRFISLSQCSSFWTKRRRPGRFCYVPVVSLASLDFSVDKCPVVILTGGRLIEADMLIETQTLPFNE